MTDLRTYLRDQLSASYLDHPIDHEQTYTYQFAVRENGTVMPPSPGVSRYVLSYEYTGTSVIYDLDVKWRPIVHWLVKQIEPWQITHRSRSAVIAASPLRVPENAKRIANLKEWGPTFEKYSLSAAKSRQLFDLVMSKTLKYLTYDPKWINHYIKEHVTSSLGGGFKWRDTLSMPMSEWKDVFDQTKENIELMSVNPGKYLNIVFNHGLRARSPDIPKFQDFYSGEIERTRIVMFHQYLSLWNVFLPNKKEWYSEILSEVEDMFDVGIRIYYPFVEGGDIYLKASELLSDGFRLVAYDGKSWEASVGNILGEAFRPMMVYMNGTWMLPSGIAVTSLLGTIASVIVNRNSNGYGIFLGDDQNHFIKGELTGIPRVPWIEEQIMDSKTSTILGASFWDPLAPRLTGLKVMSDRADKAMPLQLDRTVHTLPAGPKRDPREVAAWAGMYLGYYGDGTLITQLKRVKLEDLDYIAPREVIDNLVQTDTIDPFAWTEETGTKKLVMST